MIVSSGTFGVNPSLYPDLPYRPLVDFLPITNIFLVPLVIVAHPSFQANTLAELIELARKEPGQLSYASAGPGTSQHLSMELFKMRAKLDIVHIPYKGSGPAMADLLGGHVKLMMDSTAAALSADHRQAHQGAGRHHGAPRRAAARRHPADRRYPAGLRRRRLVGPRGTGAHAARDRGQGEPGREHAVAGSRRGARDRTARRPARARLAHPVRRVHQEGDRHLGRGRARDRARSRGLDAGARPSSGALMHMLFRTAGILPAHDHDAGRRPAVRKTMSAHWSPALQPRSRPSAGRRSDRPPAGR